MRWRLIIEEFSPELISLKGERNIIADALSRLELQNSDVPSTKMHDLRYLAEHFALEDEHLQSDAFPVHYKLLAQHQSHQKDFFYKTHARLSSQILSWRRYDTYTGLP
jgi:hypothetical protein